MAAAPPRPWWPIALIAGAAIAAFANALGHPFLLDDAGAIVDNQTIRSWWASLAGGPRQFPTAGRPLVNASFAINYGIAGLTPWWYHATNLGVHVSCALVLFALVRRMLQLPRIPAAARNGNNAFALALAFLWAVHPVNSEIVNYATQRSESMMALALLATLYGGVRAIGTGPAWWYGASIVACAAGMACKESMAVAPVLMLLLDATFISGGLLAAVRARPRYYAALGATEILLALLIMGGPRSNSAGFSSGVAPWTYALNQAPLILHYLRLSVWPVGLVLDYGEPVSRTLREAWPAVAAVIALLAGTLVAWFRLPAAGFLGLWFFVTLAPTSSLVPIATEVGAERRMYLPLAAVLAALLAAAWRLLVLIQEPGKRRAVTIGAVGAAGALLVGLTVVRNGEYATGVSLWQTVVDRRPTGRARYYLGRELAAAGRRSDAIAQYRLALETSPDANYALGFELAGDSRHGEAIDYFRRFIGQRPIDGNVPRAYYNLGVSLMAVGRHDDAAAAFRDALARAASMKEAALGLATAQSAMQRWADAAASYAAYLRLAPGDATALFNMGLALTRVERFDEARSAFAAVVTQQSGNAAAHANLASALARTGRVEEAVEEFRRAAALEPDPAARQQLQQVIADLQPGR